MKIGDKVSWTHFSKGKGSFSMCLKKGEVAEFIGNCARIKLPNGYMQTILTVRLKLEGEKSQISEFVELVRGNL